MKDYCPKTCGMCADLEGETGAVIIQSKCEDKDVRCPGWASYVNYKCSKFLGDNCPKSCRNCTDVSYVETSNHNHAAIVIDGGRPSIVIDGGHGWQLGGGSGCNTISPYLLHITYSLWAFFIPFLGKILTLP